VTQLLILSSAAAYIIYLLMYASLADPVRSWAAKRFGMYRRLLDEDCVICASFWATLALTPAALTDQFTLNDLAGTPFIAALLILTARALTAVEAVLLTYIEENNDAD